MLCFCAGLCCVVPNQAALPHYVRYHARQFVCAVLVLVRAMVKRPTVGHMEDTAALKQLDFDLQTVRLLMKLGGSLRLQPAAERARPQAAAAVDQLGTGAARAESPERMSSAAARAPPGDSSCNRSCAQVLMKLHNDEEDAAIAAAQSQPGEPVWCLQSPEILPAAGLSANTVLTSEQVRVVLTHVVQHCRRQSGQACCVPVGSTGMYIPHVCSTPCLIPLSLLPSDLDCTACCQQHACPTQAAVR